ncbi:unnamed protein product [Phyllotreta striolata]|uniref:Uncharacterized protein n=1 Tax=Phyllotreta striolata TaxID=444603 RepID=A0A9N9TW51_PHYSR|nr:unnamed protein product [Phyllotreta striolata]
MTQSSASHDNVQAMKFVLLLFRLVFLYFPSYPYASALRSAPRAEEQYKMIHEGISARDCNMVKPKSNHCELRQIIPILEKDYYGLEYYKLKCNAINLGGNTIAAPTMCFTNDVPTAGEYLAASSTCNWCYDAPQHLAADYVNIRKGDDASVTFIELDPPLADPCQSLEISSADQPDALEGFNWSSRKTYDREDAGHCKRSVPTAALYEMNSFWGFQHPNCREPIPIRDFYQEYRRQKSETASAGPTIPSMSQKKADEAPRIIDDDRLAELERRVESSENEIEELRTDNGKLKDTIGSLKTLKGDVDKKMEELKREMNEPESNDKLVYLEDKIDHVRNHYEQMEKLQEDTTQKLIALENLCKETSPKQDDKSLENKINELENEVETAQNKLNDLQFEQSNNTKSLEQDILKFEDKINTSCSKIERLVAQMTHLSDKVSELEQFHEKIDNNIGDLSALSDRVQEMESCCKTVDTVVGELKDLGDKVSKLESPSEQIDAPMTNQEDLKNKLDDFIDGLEKSNEKLDGKLKSLGEDVAKIKERLSDNEKEIEELKEINDEVIQRMSDQSSDWNKYKLELKEGLGIFAEAIGKLEEKMAAMESANSRWVRK